MAIRFIGLTGEGELDVLMELHGLAVVGVVSQNHLAVSPRVVVVPHSHRIVRKL